MFFTYPKKAFVLVALWRFDPLRRLSNRKGPVIELVEMTTLHETKKPTFIEHV